MAYLDNERVVDLVADIKALADTTYAIKGYYDQPDLDDITETGLYFCTNVAANSPVNDNDVYCYLIVIKYTGEYTYVKQIFLRQGSIGVTEHETYARTKFGTIGTWGDWYKILTERDLYSERYTGTADDLTKPGVYLVDSISGSGFPESGTNRQGIVQVYKASANGTATKQVFWRVVVGNDNDAMQRVWIRSKYDTTAWQPWTAISSTTVTLSSPAVVSALPTGVTGVNPFVVMQAGNVVSVRLAIVRDSTAMNSYQTIATGLPIPKSVVTTPGNLVVPFTQIHANSSTFYRPINAYVDTNGNLKIVRGEGASTYMGTITYLTDDFSKL